MNTYGSLHLVSVLTHQLDRIWGHTNTLSMDLDEGSGQNLDLLLQPMVVDALFVIYCSHFRVWEFRV